MTQHYLRTPLFLITTAILVATGCDFSEGGLNQNEQGSGNQDDGVELDVGRIAVDPTGKYFLADADGQLLYAEIASGSTRLLDEVEDPVRVVFDDQAQRIFLTSTDDGGKIVAYRLTENKADWTVPSQVLGNFEWFEGLTQWPKLDLTSDESGLIVSDPERIRVLDTNDGSERIDVSFDAEIIDLDVLPDGQHALVTLDHEWGDEGPNTVIVRVDLNTGAKENLNVPNCADELIVNRVGTKAFLAPTTCSQDPVSVIDLESFEFVRNLPGFGPVALAPQGGDVVAFMDKENLDESLFGELGDLPEGDERYHMMFIDPKTLQFDSIPLGDELPRYALTPDGKILLIDSNDWYDDARLRVLDIEKKEMVLVAGPDVRLNEYVITNDSQRAMLVDDGLFEIDIPERVVGSVAIDFIPEHINITPDDKYVLLREENEDRIWVVDGTSYQKLRAVGW